MTVIKKVDIMSAAKIMAIVCVIFGLIADVFMLLALIITLALGSDSSSIGIQIMLLIAIPIGYGVLGFIMGAIEALIYNLASKWIGGIKVELENK